MPDATGETLPRTRSHARPLRHLLGLALLIQPAPGLLVTAGVAALSLLAARTTGTPLAADRLVRLCAAVVCQQAAIGAFNDYRDRGGDTLSRRPKPLARGWVAPGEALALGLLTLIGMIVIATPLGIVPLALVVAGAALGLAYDFGLKGTPLSALLYALALPLIPLLAWAVFGRWQPFLPWALPLGAALGLALNVSNVLPDLGDDAAAGIRGLPHLLGWRMGRLVAWGTPPLVLGAMLLLAATGLVPARPAGMIVAAVGALVPSLAAPLLYRLHPRPLTLRICFLLQGAGVIVLGAGWLAAVG